MPETGERHDPYPGFAFLLAIDDLAVAGFSECSGLEVEIETEDYPAGGENDFVHKLPGRRKYSDLVLKRGVAGTELWGWLHQQVLGQIDPRSLHVHVRDPDAARAELIVEIKHAFPTKWQGPQLDAGQSQIALETLTLGHHGFELLPIAKG